MKNVTLTVLNELEILSVIVIVSVMRCVYGSPPRDVVVNISPCVV